MGQFGLLGNFYSMSDAHPPAVSIFCVFNQKASQLITDKLTPYGDWNILLVFKCQAMLKKPKLSLEQLNAGPST